MKCLPTLVIPLLCVAARAQVPLQPPPQAPPATQPLAAIGEATPVTFTLDRASPKEAFDRLEAASKIPLAAAQADLLTRNDDKAISVKFDREPYLSAVLELCRQANLQINTFGTRLTILPAPDHRVIPPHVASGPIEIFCNAVTMVREIRHGAAARATASVVLNFSLISEARVPVVGIEPAARNAVAMDDRGVSLQQIGAQRPAGAQLGDTFNDGRFFTAQFSIDAVASHTLSRLTGSVVARVVTRIDSLRIKDVLSAEGSSTKIGDCAVTVARAEPNGQGGQWQVDLDVSSPSLTPTFFSRVRFNDSQFTPRVEPAGNQVRLNNIQARNDGTTLSLIFTLPAGAAKPPIDLVWPLPAEVKRVEVPFEFRDLPLR